MIVVATCPRLLFGFDAITIWPLILIKPERIHDAGLLAHEMVHYRRQTWVTPLWWLAYLLAPSFRLREEVLAYKRSVGHGMPLNVAADWLLRYRCGIDKHRAIELLQS